MSEETPSLIEGLAPKEGEIEYTIGPYQVLKSIGKGGMGEVLLAYDTSCGRRIALKKIRGDLVEHTQIYKRFLKEARITCQLTHPAIIPIYVIEDQKEGVFYTMPYIQGETLKRIIKKAREEEKKGELTEPHVGSIASLVRIFLAVCQAVAYAHSKGVLHRDLKPENVMVGKYGEVSILDWGLAEMIDAKEEAPEVKERRHKMTRMGKVVGTISYMAPERAFGQPATVQTDIYSLGVILYQILTLRSPFRRGTLTEFRRKIEKEKLLEPQEVAPWRDIPPILARIATRCLARTWRERYGTVDELIHDLENYIEGRSEWFAIKELDITESGDWEFQEHVLIAEHVAITRAQDLSDWVNLMISKASFSENTRLEATVRIDDEGSGIGFLLSVPEPAEREHINDGFCLWIASDLTRTTRLFKSTVEVVSAREVYIKRGEWTKIRIEKIGNNLHLYLNNTLQFSYISHLPQNGTHVGVMTRDTKFAIEDLIISVASQNLTVGCLAVADTLLAHKLWGPALAEYRRIGYSFPGRKEGREALFSAGITLLEEAKCCKDSHEKETLFDAALEEFEKLHITAGAPLEYLGKSLVYAAMGEDEEEYKCIELAFRRYKNHPLLKVLEEHLAFRLHQSARVNKKRTYHFVLTILCHTETLKRAAHVEKLFAYIKKHGEKLPFISNGDELFAAEIAFWLGNVYVLTELLSKCEQGSKAFDDIAFLLLELGAWKELLGKIEPGSSLAPLFLLHKESISSGIREFLASAQQEERICVHLMERALDFNEPHLALEVAAPLSNLRRVIELKIWALLQSGAFGSAAKLLQQFSLDELMDESSLLFILYGCYLRATEGKEIAEAHFSGAIDEVGRPFLEGGGVDSEGLKGMFWYSRKRLFRELALYRFCSGDVMGGEHFLGLVRQGV